MPTEKKRHGVPIEEDGRRRRSEHSRARVWEATLSLAEERGFDALDVATIVDRSGVSRRTFYRWFGGKEGVITGFVQAERERFTDRFTRPPSRPVFDDLIDRLKALEEGRNLTLDRRLWSIVQRSDTLRLLYQAEVAFYQHALAEWLARASLDVEPEVLAAAILGARQVGVRRWLSAAEQTPRWPFVERALKPLAALFAE